MNSVDIWRGIVIWLPITDVVRCRFLSKKHKEISDEILDSRSTIMSIQLLKELTTWAYQHVRMSKMTYNPKFYTGLDENSVKGPFIIRETHDMFDVEGLFPPNTSSSDYTPLVQPFSYEFHIPDDELSYNESIWEYIFSDHAQNCKMCQETEYSCGWKYVPTFDEIKFDTLLKLPWTIYMSNPSGANHDLRGVKTRFEFLDFTDFWIFKSPYITIRQFVEGCYRLKSHKFENWYEMIHGVEKYELNENYCGEGSMLRVTLSVDHGS